MATINAETSKEARKAMIRNQLVLLVTQRNQLSSASTDKTLDTQIKNLGLPPRVVDELFQVHIDAIDEEIRQNLLEFKAIVEK